MFACYLFYTVGSGHAVQYTHIVHAKVRNLSNHDNIGPDYKVS